MTNSTDIRQSSRKRVHKKFHDEKQSLCKTTDLKMKRISNTMFDAGSLSLHALKIMKTDSISRFNNKVDFRKCSIDIIDVLFPKKKFRGSLNPPYSRRISSYYISFFRSLNKKDQLLIITNSDHSIDFSEDTMKKCSGIFFNDVCIYDVTSASIASQGFRHVVIEALINFANFVSTGTDWPYQDAKCVLFDNKITSNQNAKWLLKETFRPFTNDKVNCYYFVSTNCLKYNKTDQDKCVECRNVTLLKTFRKRCNRAVEIRNNDNAIIS